MESYQIQVEDKNVKFAKIKKKKQPRGAEMIS